MIGVWLKGILQSFSVRAIIDQRVQRQIFFSAEADCWDRQTRIVVAKVLLSTFAIAKSKQNGIGEGRATANKPCAAIGVWSTLLSFSIWSMRDSISFPDDVLVRCADRGARGAVAMLYVGG